jgi:ArsR family transcriptional regulator
VLKALASPVRLKILADLKDPVGNFLPQVDGDPVVDGICADFIRERLGLAPATASRHLSVLAEAKARKIGGRARRQTSCETRP